MPPHRVFGHSGARPTGRSSPVNGPAREGAAVLGDPASFLWSMFTEELGPLGTNSVRHLDAVPDGGIGTPVAWPPD